MKVIEPNSDASFQKATELRELNICEIQVVSGGVGTTSFSSTYQGGNDGYGGSRRNP